MAAETKARLEPVRKSVTVKRSVAEAFAIFTEGLDRWWPLRTYSVGKDDAVRCGMECRKGGELFEIDEVGTRRVWGKVVVWEPPARLVISWHPHGDPATAQEVEVRFTDDHGRTRVDLEHRNWEGIGDEAAAARERYAGGWELVMGQHFAEGCRRG